MARNYLREIQYKELYRYLTAAESKARELDYDGYALVLNNMRQDVADTGIEEMKEAEKDDSNTD